MHQSFLRSGLDAFGRWICGANWFADVVQPSANNLTDSLTTTLNSAIDIFFPLKSTKLHTTDKPWISHAIKSLIQKRQNAFNNNDPVLWRHYKNKVKKEITKRKKVFYEDKVKHLKVIPQFCIAHFYCAHLITYNFIHYTYTV